MSQVDFADWSRALGFVLSILATFGGVYLIQDGKTRSGDTEDEEAAGVGERSAQVLTRRRFVCCRRCVARAGGLRAGVLEVWSGGAMCDLVIGTTNVGRPGSIAPRTMALPPDICRKRKTESCR